LRHLLRESLPTRNDELVGISRNIESNRLSAVGITTSDYGTGRSITWVQGKAVKHWTRPHRISVSTRLTVEHIMASAALPLLFPAIALDDGWHGDGGIRLTAPLAPAMHLGADRILAISTRKPRTPGDMKSTIHGYPPPAQVIGNLTNAIFLDMLDFDALNMTRINQLVRALPDDRRGGLRPVDVLVLRPSEDLGRLAARFERRLPRSIRFFTRGFGTKETEAPDSLALLMFEQDYLDYLIKLGEADAEARCDEICEFLDF
jgi:NTE family protein